MTCGIIVIGLLGVLFCAVWVLRHALEENLETTEMSDDRDDDGTDFGLVMPFLTDDVKFAHGVEFGMLWEQLKHCDHISGPYLVANQDHILLALSRLKWHVVELKAIDEFWFHIEAELTPPTATTGGGETP